MANKDPEKQSRQNFDSITTKKILHSDQNQLLNKNKSSKLGRCQLFRSSCLLVLLGLTIILGTVSISSTQIRSVTEFPQEILDTLLNKFELFSLHIPCTILKGSSQSNGYHDDEKALGAMRQSNLKAERLSIEIMKRATSNGTNIVEELQTAPLNSPTTTITSSTLIPPGTEVTISSTVSSASLPTSRVTSSTVGTFSRSLSTVITTVISTVIVGTSSQLSFETLTGSLEITTPTEITSGNDLSTSTSDFTSPSTTRARQTVYTTTLSSGGLSTLTSITIIETAIEQTDSMSATKTKETAGLQTNIAQKIEFFRFGQLIGIVGLVFAIAH